MSDVLIFGYGSLIHPQSRAHTASCGEAQFATLHGFQRSWEVCAPERQCSFLGIHPQADAQVNGVLFSIDASTLAAFDQRERHYQRITLQPEQCMRDRSDGDQAPFPDLPIYTYQTLRPIHPSAEQPIHQSYVNICLLGCLQHSEAMAQTFVNSTSHWQLPLYQNNIQAPFIPQANEQSIINALLQMR